jgi:hypothetical protein
MTRDDIIRMAREAGAMTGTGSIQFRLDGALERFAALVAAHEREAEKQEPVAWLYLDSWGTLKLSQIMPAPVGAFPVYTTPQRQPLTEEEIMQTWEGVIKYAPGEVRLKDFARAIEHAHGIGGGQ